MRAKEEDAEAGGQGGLAPAPRLAIVSGSLDLPWDEPVFRESTLPPLIVTGTDADPAGLAGVPGTCEVVTLAGEAVDPAAILDALEARGLRRDRLRGRTDAAPRVRRGRDLLDEADITVSPMFTGTGHEPADPGAREVAEFELAQVLTADGFLMARYLCAGAT